MAQKDAAALQKNVRHSYRPGNDAKIAEDRAWRHLTNAMGIAGLGLRPLYSCRCSSSSPQNSGTANRDSSTPEVRTKLNPTP